VADYLVGCCYKKINFFEYINERLITTPLFIFSFLVEPTDINFGGKVHGGIVMKCIEQAGYACAAEYTLLCKFIYWWHTIYSAR
jgi:acyl-coenzyme A thioesterase PaaI-like protein